MQNHGLVFVALLASLATLDVLYTLQGEGSTSILENCYITFSTRNKHVFSPLVSVLPVSWMSPLGLPLPLPLGNVQYQSSWVLKSGEQEWMNTENNPNKLKNL